MPYNQPVPALDMMTRFLRGEISRQAIGQIFLATFAGGGLDCDSSHEEGIDGR